MIQIQTAQAIDLPDIERLLDAGFGPARHNRTAYRLREGLAPDPTLSFIARDDGVLVGSVQCWPLQLRVPSGPVQRLTLLGPVVVAAAAQGRGIATGMVGAALAAADACGAAAMLLIGDEEFYGRFGFSAVGTAGWQLPGPVDRHRLLLRGDAAALSATGQVEPRGQVRRAA